MTDPTARYFTSDFKARNRLAASAAIVLASAAPFALGLIAITFLVSNPTGWAAGAITFAALGCAGVFTWLAQNRLALLGNRRLRRKLRRHLRDHEELGHCKSQTTFAGFSPGDSILSWDGETDLDVGFVCVSEHGMIFVGDLFTWSLGKDRIDRIELTPAPMGPRRILIRWHAPREPDRALALASREADSARQADAATVRLFKRLRKWSAVVPERAPKPLPLGYPPTGTFDGRPFDEPPQGWCAVTLAMCVIIVLTIWYLVSEMLGDRFYFHAILWAGFVFVGGAVFTRCLLHYLQSTVGPRRA